MKISHRGFAPLGFECFKSGYKKKKPVHHFYRDTQRRNFRPLEDKILRIFMLQVILKNIYVNYL
jgi:hypothetical protein